LFFSAGAAPFNRAKRKGAVLELSFFANGIDPNVLVGMAMKESSLDPTKTSTKSTASGLFGLEKGVRDTYGVSDADTTGSSPSAIISQVNAAASYLHDLMKGSVPAGHPDHQLEIAIGYYRGSRKGVNKAMASKGGYDAMLKLRYGGETLGKYIEKVESFQ
jgi:Transglycosylase SLT domain